MVSELSLRLLRGREDKFSFNTTSNKLLDGERLWSPSVVSSSDDGGDAEPMLSFRNRTEKLSKIIAARSSQGNSNATTAATTATSSSKVRKIENQKEEESRDDGCFKRRRIDEHQFAASRVRKDLEQGGLSFPSLYENTKHLELFSDAAENKGVRLLSASSVSSSPFLVEVPGSKDSFFNASELKELFAVTYDSYSKPADWESTSSMTSESENSNRNGSNPTPTDIPSLLDTSLNNRTKNSSGDDDDDDFATTNAIYSNPISIGEAFQNSSEPRLVTLSIAPFLIVHINSAYTRMTGLSPTDILGKGFHEVIQDQTFKAKASKASSLALLHNQTTDFVVMSTSDSNDKETNQERLGMKVTVVSADAEQPQEEVTAAARDSITHFMISLESKSSSTAAKGPAMTLQTAAAASSTSNASSSNSNSALVANRANDFSSTVAPLDTSVAPLDTPSSPATTSSLMRFHCGVMG